jgi:hypothetical protein
MQPPNVKSCPRIFFFISCIDTIKSSVWTTGSSEGEACDLQRKFAWCPTGRMLNESQMADARYWVTPPDGSASIKRCLELNYDASTGARLANADCSADKKSFICQVENSAFSLISCPSKRVSTMNAAKFLLKVKCQN